MTIGTILLTEDNCYVDDRKQLPHRAIWDKEWLTTLVSLNTISKKGYDMLPPSMQKVANVTHGEPSLAITIPELDELPDLLFVIRSTRRVSNGKKFKLDKYKRIAASCQIEIWKRK
jgi:hypothetical protein